MVQTRANTELRRAAISIKMQVIRRDGKPSGELSEKQLIWGLCGVMDEFTKKLQEVSANIAKHDPV